MEKSMKTTIDGLVAPNASDAYRGARAKLYVAERELLAHIEQVAQMRRALPGGPEVPDYEFVGLDGPTRLSQLFNPHLEPYLVMYHVMYWVDEDSFCPMCSGWIDALNGITPHITQRVNFVAASQAPPQRLQQWAKQRGWNRVSVLSDIGTGLADAIGARDEDGDPVSTVAVFSKDAKALRRFEGLHDAHRVHWVNELSLRWPFG
jgi:predicted dithiol-disulfide oxidoreductase (DUF899 family)